MPPRVFTDDQVIEIVALHAIGKDTAYIVARYGHPSTVREILMGQSYLDVTHAKKGPCHCPSCRVRARCDANLDIADAAVIDVACVMCPTDPIMVTRRSTLVQQSHGQVLCDKHDQRRQ